jgi:hypothetical protein
LIVAAGVWRGSNAARVVAMVVGPLAILPGLLGAFGLWMVAQGWTYCIERQFAMVASYPADYCQRVDWVTQWGIGLGLAGAGVAGLLVFMLLIAAGPGLQAQSATPNEEPATFVDPW